jgi:hypothetical protein
MRQPLKTIEKDIYCKAATNSLFSVSFLGTFLAFKKK